MEEESRYFFWPLLSWNSSSFLSCILWIRCRDVKKLIYIWNLSEITRYRYPSVFHSPTPILSQQFTLISIFRPFLRVGCYSTLVVILWFSTKLYHIYALRIISGGYGLMGPKGKQPSSSLPPLQNLCNFALRSSKHTIYTISCLGP